MRILNTTETSAAIEQVISNSNEFLVLVSPYLRIADRLIAKIEDAATRCEVAFVVFRANTGSGGNESQLERLQSLGGLQTFAIPNLYAKCYVNERCAIVTSLNLYDYSQVNNFEIGVEITAAADKSDYLKLVQQIDEVVRVSEGRDQMEKVLNLAGVYTMGRLYEEVCGEYRFPGADSRAPDGTYHRICEIARGLTQFEPHQLYQDGSAILRSTRLSRSTYVELRREISKIGTRIR